ncbi:hypothetical protein JNUCC31_21650 [Paenibacillus sp. JNUCC31]|uniref:hypothetical protein n=1 Tax=unclassified Paenibacillus TaxID=185978 RepID=UPI00177D1518|nr:hypothetical protein [Paenibacillus sp. JNUCC-31]QOS77381.1 hypothetical protein JNUCC31_21650 [Paenibacillus sp. JNUCC-31]
MKAVPKVTTDGLYIEDVLVDDAFSGVVPLYAKSEPPVFDPEENTEVENPVNEPQEPVIAGYIVGVPITSGLFRPLFHLEAWEAYQESPEAVPKTNQPVLWAEGLSQEEIDELTKPLPKEPSELDLLKQRLAEAEAKNAQLTEESTLNQVALMELHAMILEMTSGNRSDKG